MSGREDWMAAVEDEAGAIGPIRPAWHMGVPTCAEECRYHDGKRCEILGARPDRICEPAVETMSAMLSRRDA